MTEIILTAELEAEWEAAYFAAIGEFGPIIDIDAENAIEALDDIHHVDHETYVSVWLDGCRSDLACRGPQPARPSRARGQPVCRAPRPPNRPTCRRARGRREGGRGRTRRQLEHQHQHQPPPTNRGLSRFETCRRPAKANPNRRTTPMTEGGRFAVELSPAGETIVRFLGQAHLLPVGTLADIQLTADDGGRMRATFEAIDIDGPDAIAVALIIAGME